MRPPKILTIQSNWMRVHCCAITCCATNANASLEYSENQQKYTTLFLLLLRCLPVSPAHFFVYFECQRKHKTMSSGRPFPSANTSVSFDYLTFFSSQMLHESDYFADFFCQYWGSLEKWPPTVPWQWSNIWLRTQLLYFLLRGGCSFTPLGFFRSRRKVKRKQTSYSTVQIEAPLHLSQVAVRLAVSWLWWWIAAPVIDKAFPRFSLFGLFLPPCFLFVFFTNVNSINTGKEKKNKNTNVN